MTIHLNEYAASEIVKSTKVDNRQSDHIYEELQLYSHIYQDASLNMQKVLASPIYADLNMPEKKKFYNLNCACNKKRLIICSIGSLLVSIALIVAVVLAVLFTKSIFLVLKYFFFNF